MAGIAEAPSLTMDGNSKIQAPNLKKGPGISLQSPCELTVIDLWNSFGIWDLGFGIWDLDFGIWNLDFGLWDLDFGIWNLGFCAGDDPVPRDGRPLCRPARQGDARAGRERSAPRDRIQRHRRDVLFLRTGRNVPASDLAAGKTGADVQDPGESEIRKSGGDTFVEIGDWELAGRNGFDQFRISAFDCTTERLFR